MFANVGIRKMTRILRKADGSFRAAQFSRFGFLHDTLPLSFFNKMSKRGTYQLETLEHLIYNVLWKAVVPLVTNSV